MDMKVKQEELIIASVPATMIDLIWDKVEPLLQLVVDKSPEDIVAEVTKEELLKGNLLLVTISRGAELIAINVLDIRTLDSGIKALYICITAGSEMDLWMDKILEFGIAVAKEHNCVELRGFAVRNGWVRKLKPYGWEELFVTLRYKIGE